MPNFRFENIRKILISVILASILFGSGYAFGVYGFQINYQKNPIVTISRIVPLDKNLDFSLFWNVWDTLHDNYKDPDKLIESELVYGAIKGMVVAVDDPYTVFLSPKENKVVQEDLSGNFEGVGIQIGFRNDKLTVIAPLPGTPAEEVDIRAGDVIVRIKDDLKGIDTVTNGISLPQAVQLIRGPARTKVTLTILREGEDDQLEKVVTRKAIDVPSVKVSYTGNVAHVIISRFGVETMGEWNKIVDEITRRRNIKGVVLDVRNNPGGFMRSAADVASEFLASGTVVIEVNSQGEQDEYKGESRKRLTKMPVVVLVNEGSASASEILAGALRDNARAEIVGTVTFGKASVQEPIQIGSSALHVTVSGWLTPSGKSVDEEGLEPDIIVEDDLETEEDEQLQEAIRLLSSDQ